MVTLRLDPELEDEIKKQADSLGITKSELIRKSIVCYMETLTPPNAWEVGRDLFGKYASGQENLSTNRKKILKKKIRSKRK